MKTLNFQPIHQDSVACKAMELKSKIEYTKNYLKNYSLDMADFQIKEYKELIKEDSEQLQQYIVELKNNESVFNQFLYLYGLTVTVFIAKYLL